MLTTWLNSAPNLDYQRAHTGVQLGAAGLVTGLFHMKFSTRFDTEMTAAELFDVVGDFGRVERMLVGRGANVSRIDPARDPGTGVGWNIAFSWRGRERKLRLDVTRYDRPERMTIEGISEALDISINATVVALSRTRSRLVFEVELRPRNMKARLMLQTAKLAKPQLDRRFSRRVGEILQEMRGTG